MAVWQFQCNIIPVRPDNEEMRWEEVISWRDMHQPPQDIAFLEHEASWCQEIVQYGKLNETCIEFIYSKNVLEEISCRLDLRSQTKENFVLLIQYVKDIGALFSVEGRIYPPEKDVLLEIMKQSNANQYCKNPSGYFASLKYKFGGETSKY